MNDSMLGKLVLITGGAQGLGLHAAAEFADAGCTLILTDINPGALAKAKKRLEARGAVVHTIAVDVTDRKAVEALAARVVEEFGYLDVLINNAGIGFHAELADTSLETWKKLIDVNLWGVLHHIYAFLPAMKARGGGQIVNISSGQAFFRLPTWGAYASVKLAVGAISDVLHYELKKYNIDVTTIYPYVVRTGFYDEVTSGSLGGKLSMVFLPLYAQTPEKVGRIIFNAVKKRKRTEMVNPINILAKYLMTFPVTANATNSLLTAVLTAGKKGDRPQEQPSVLSALRRQAGDLLGKAAGPVGFGIDERMIGNHEFRNGAGPEGQFPFQFDVRWGVDSLADWANPSGDTFLVNRMEGTVSIGGWVEGIPCTGRLEIRYHDGQRIRYVFDFEYQGKAYQYIGEKREIYPWNLPYSHTTCFGEVREVKSGKLVSESVTHFLWSDLPEFLRSLRIVRGKDGGAGEPVPEAAAKEPQRKRRGKAEKVAN